MLLNKKIDKCYAWASDLSSNSGEGNLARLFIKKKLCIYDLKIVTHKNIFGDSWVTHFLNYKYISPFVGIICCWFNFFKNTKIAYINYLPLWNCFLFLLLPPGTILGPITGGANYKKNKKGYFVRRYIFPKLYKISELFLSLRNIEIIFSTSLLKKYLLKKTIENSKFNFIFNYYKLNIKLINLLKKTKFSISSDENLYSLFFMECINNHVKVITDYSNFKKISHFKKNFVFINYKKIQNLNWLKKT